MKLKEYDVIRTVKICIFVISCRLHASMVAIGKTQLLLDTSFCWESHHTNLGTT